MMKYVNSFTNNIKGNECFLTLEQMQPQGEETVKTALKTIVMSEDTARHLASALNDLYSRIDQDRLAKSAAPGVLKRS